tara:strand:+ start:1728 stop:2711 length:984 start_codon:yes stop_codon:yes gene_type:complete
MINTKNLQTSASSIPSYWIFQYYLSLSETLTGQDIKIKSVFNPSEKTPSFCIYVDKSIMQYKFKDFSTGKNGDKIDLVQMLFDINYSNAMNRILSDYNNYISKNGKSLEVEFNVKNKWEVDYIKKRSWNENDARYWLQYRIGSKILNEYNVYPIEYYNLIQEENNEVNSITIRKPFMYGYFDTEGEVYKIYQPRGKHKFHKVKSYIQGFDQLKFKEPYLIICSSLKDAICLKGMGYNIEVIAPDSENTMIKPHIIEHLKGRYKKVITLFDNDQAGLEAIEKYKNLYGLHGCVLSMSKDISDAMEKHGFDKVHAELKILLKETINKIL